MRQPRPAAPVRASVPTPAIGALLAGALLAVVPGPSGAAPVGDAIDRTAIAVRSPQSAVLLAAALAGERVVAVGERGLVVLSDDGGASWRQAPAPVSVTLTGVRFADARRGWAIGHGAVVLATDDGGEHWVRRLDGRTAAQRALEDAKAGGDERALKDAEQLVTDGPDKPLLDLVVFDAQRLLVVGAYGLALYSDDAGASWTSWATRLPNPKGLHLYAARRHGERLLLAGEQGLALQSADGGQHFRRLETPYKGTFFSAEVLEDGTLLLAGLRGNMLRSRDDGVTWTPVASPMPVSITATAVTPGGGILAVNQAGFVLEVRDDRLLPLNPTPLPPLNGLLPRAGAPLLAMSVLGVLALPATPGGAK